MEVAKSSFRSFRATLRLATIAVQLPFEMEIATFAITAVTVLAVASLLL